MATSTFGKQFAVKKERAGDFVKVMTKKANPTLKKDFKSSFSHERELREQLEKVLR